MSNKQNSEHKADNNELIVNYLNVANAAISAHKDEFPYKQIKTIGEKVLEDKIFGIAIFKSDTSHPHDFYTVRYKGDAFHLVAHGKKDPDITWKFKESYLEQVKDNPDEYIKSPSKLDWDWLKSFVQ